MYIFRRVIVEYFVDATDSGHFMSFVQETIAGCAYVPIVTPYMRSVYKLSQEETKIIARMTTYCRGYSRDELCVSLRGALIQHSEMDEMSRWLNQPRVIGAIADWIQSVDFKFDTGLSKPATNKFDPTATLKMTSNVHRRQHLPVYCLAKNGILPPRINPPVAPDSSQYNEVQALRSRILLKKHPAVDGIWNTAIQEMADVFCKPFVNRFPPVPTFRQWLPTVKAGIRNAVLHAHQQAKFRSFRPSMAAHTGFVKAELFPYSKSVDGYIPRMVLSMSNYMYAETGPFLTSLGTFLHDFIFSWWSGANADPANGIKLVWLSGNPVEIGLIWCLALAYLGLGAHGIETDGERWDGHLCAQALMAVTLIYRLFGIESHSHRRAWQYVVEAIACTIFTRHDIRAFVQGARKSGGFDTSSGNSVMGLAVSYRILRKHGITKAVVFQCGDDNVILLPADCSISVSDLIEDFSEYGIVAKSIEKPVSELSFCSGHFYPAVLHESAKAFLSHPDSYTKESFVFCTKAGRLLEKLGYSLSQDAVHSPEAAHSVGYGMIMSMLPQARVHPVLGPLFSHILAHFGSDIDLALAQKEVEARYYTACHNDLETAESLANCYSAAPGADDLFASLYPSAPISIFNKLTASPLDRERLTSLLSAQEATMVGR